MDIKTSLYHISPDLSQRDFQELLIDARRAILEYHDAALELISRGVSEEALEVWVLQGEIDREIFLGITEEGAGA